MPEYPNIEEQNLESTKYIDVPSPATESALIKQLNLTETIDHLEHLLRNEKLVNGEWVKEGKPLLNDEGIRTLTLLLSANLNRVVALSNFTEEDVNQMAQETADVIIDTLYMQYKNWGVDVKDLDLIVNIVDRTNFSMLKWAFNEGIRNLLKSTQKTTERIVYEKPKKSLFGIFKGGD